MKIREYNHLDELNRLPRDYVQLDKNANPKPISFKKRLLIWIFGMVGILLVFYLIGLAIRSLI